MQKKATKKGKSEIIKTVNAPVVFNEKTLFNIHVSILSFSPEDRARLIGDRIRKLAADPRVGTDSIIAVDSENISIIAAGDLIIMTVTDEDARAAGKKRSDLATEYVGIMRNAIEEQRHAYSLEAILIGVLLSFGLTILIIPVLHFHKEDASQDQR